jgi:hypothetical protein
MSVSTVSNTPVRGLETVVSMATNGYLSAGLTVLFYKTLTVLHFAREAWKLYGRVKPITVEGGIFKISAGYILQKVAGNYDAVRIAAYLLLINNRFNECRKAAAEVKSTWDLLRKAIRNEYSAPQKSYANKKSFVLLPASTTIWLYETSDAVQSRAKRIVFLVLELFKDIFKLVMYTLDVTDAVRLNPLDKNSDVRVYEIFYNAEKSFEQLQKDIKGLHKLTIENKKLLSEFLLIWKEKGVPLPSYEDIVSSLELVANPTVKSVASTVASKVAMTAASASITYIMSGVYILEFFANAVSNKT